MCDIATLRERGIPEEFHVINTLQHTVKSSLLAEQESSLLVERMAAVHLKAERPKALSPVLVQQSVDPLVL